MRKPRRVAKVHSLYKVAAHSGWETMVAIAVFTDGSARVQAKAIRRGAPTETWQCVSEAEAMAVLRSIGTVIEKQI